MRPMLAGLVVAVLGAGLAHAQGSKLARASLAGKVMLDDSKPAALAKLRLTAYKDGKEDKGREQSVTTAADGAFQFADLEPGAYLLSISMKFKSASEAPCRPQGFLTRSRNKWLVAVGRDKEGNVVQVVTSDELTLKPAERRRETIDMRCD